MAISSIHIEAGADGYFAHNSREKHTENAIFNDEENYCSCSNAKAFEIYKSELEKRSEAYTSRTGQKLQKNIITHLSAIVNLNQEHTEKDLQLIVEYLEYKLDTKVIQFAIHRDEGHLLNDATDELRKRHSILNEDDKIKNYHAHIEIMGLDSTGASIRRKLDKKFLSELQTDVADMLNMERGVNYLQGEVKRPKRLDTYEFKAHKKNEIKTVIAKQKDLKEKIKELREQLKEAGAVRADYSLLEEENRKLKEQVKNKELSEKDLKNQIERIAQMLSVPSGETSILNGVKELKNQIESDKKYKANKAVNDYELKEYIKNIEDENANLKHKIAMQDDEYNELVHDFNSQADYIDELKEQIEELKEKIEVLEKRNKSNFGMSQSVKDDLYEQKRILSILEEENKDYPIEDAMEELNRHYRQK